MKSKDTKELFRELRRLQVKGTLLHLWYNTVVRFAGPVKVWSKAIEQLIEVNEGKNNFSTKESLRFFIDNVYVRKKPVDEYYHRPFLEVQLYSILYGFKIERLTYFFSVDYKVRLKEKTNRYDYKIEKRRNVRTNLKVYMTIN